MKAFRSLTLALAILWLPSAGAHAQAPESKEHLTKEFTVSGDASRQVLALYNIFGSVAVQGYAGNKVVLEITKTVTAPDGTLLETGKREVQLGFIQRGDSIIAYNASPIDSRPNRNGQHWEQRGPHYSYTLDYLVKVPRQLNLHVSTVNNGQVSIQDVTGTLQVYNVNGAITIKNARGATQAHTVNGNVEATYTGSPAGPSSYQTINGQITASYPPDIAANVHFKSFHGELFTDFAQVERLPLQVSQNKQAAGGGTKYQLSKGTAVRLGKGGTDLRFETLNGNVTIKQQPK